MSEAIDPHAKTKWFMHFAATHKDSFYPHYLKGETLGKDPEAWRNVSEHCLVEGAVADLLAERLGLDSAARAKVVQAALMHDWNKKHESLTLGSLRKDGKLTLASLDTIRAEDEAALRELGVDEEVITLTGANVPASLEGPQTDSEKILWYVDAMLSNTDPVSIPERFRDLKRGWDGQQEDPERAANNNAFSDLYRDRYSGHSLYEVQVMLGEKIGQEFAERLGYGGESASLPLYLRGELEAQFSQGG